MGRWIPRKLLEWREPRAVAEWRDREEERRLPRFLKPKAVALVAGMLMLHRQLADGLGRPVPPFELALSCALGVGVLVVYGLPALTRRFASHAWVSEVAVSRARGDGVRHFLHDRLSAAEILAKELDGERCALLRLTAKDGSTSLIGLPPDLDLDRLREVLKGRGIPLLSPGEQGGVSQV